MRLLARLMHRYAYYRASAHSLSFAMLASIFHGAQGLFIWTLDWLNFRASGLSSGSEVLATTVALPVERAVPVLETVTCDWALVAVTPATNPVSAARIFTNFTAKLPKKSESPQ